MYVKPKGRIFINLDHDDGPLVKPPCYCRALSSAFTAAQGKIHKSHATDAFGHLSLFGDMLR